MYKLFFLKSKYKDEINGRYDQNLIITETEIFQYRTGYETIAKIAIFST